VSIDLNALAQDIEAIFISAGIDPNTTTCQVANPITWATLQVARHAGGNMAEWSLSVSEAHTFTDSLGTPFPIPVEVQFYGHVTPLAFAVLQAVSAHVTGQGSEADPTEGDEG
jgi:hypothetical protein